MFKEKSFLFKMGAACSSLAAIIGLIAVLNSYIPSVAFAADIERLEQTHIQDLNSFRVDYYQDRADRTFEQIIDVQLMQREYEQSGEPVPSLLIEKEQLLQRKLEELEQKVERYERYLEE